MLWAASTKRASRELVDDAEQFDAAQIGGLVEAEVQGPHVVGGRSAQPSGGAVGEPAALGLALRRALEAFISPDAPCALGVGHQPIVARHRIGFASPEAWMTAREVPQMLTQAGLSRVRGRLGAALGRAVLATAAHAGRSDPWGLRPTTRALKSGIHLNGIETLAASRSGSRAAPELRAVTMGKSRLSSRSYWPPLWWVPATQVRSAKANGLRLTLLAEDSLGLTKVGRASRRDVGRDGLDGGLTGGVDAPRDRDQGLAGLPRH